MADINEDAPRIDAEAALEGWRNGDPDASGLLLATVYDHLHALASSYFRGQPAGHTLQPTALVHEAWLRVAQSERRAFADSGHFAAVCAMAMRQILTDHARAKAADKRGGGRFQVTLGDIAIGAKPMVDVLTVDRLLTELAALDPRRARVVELRFFGGLSVPEVAELLSVSSRTVEKDWRGAKAWLNRALSL